MSAPTEDKPFKVFFSLERKEGRVIAPIATSEVFIAPAFNLHGWVVNPQLIRPVFLAKVVAILHFSDDGGNRHRRNLLDNG